MSSSSPQRSPGNKPELSGYLHKIDQRAIGLVARRRYWFAVSGASHYLYWYKERDDVNSSGRIDLSGAAFTYNPREKGRFEIHAGCDTVTLECATDKSRDEWMKVLQDVRKYSRSHDARDDYTHDIHNLSRDDQTPSTSQSAQNLIDTYLGPRDSIDSSTSEQSSGDATVNQVLDVPVPSTSPSSTFYLSTDGELNDKSMEMPKAIISAETVLQRIADKTSEQLVERPKRAYGAAKKSIQSLKDCEECKKRGMTDENDERYREQDEHIASLESVVKALKTALLTSQKQTESLNHLNTITNDDDMRTYILEKEKVITELQMENNGLHKHLQKVEHENRLLDGKVSELTTSVEAFRDSLRTKEALIIRMFEEHAPETKVEDVKEVTGDVDVPEGILVDDLSILCDETAQKMFVAEGVRDVNELKDLVDGYKAQNSFLNHEIIELHGIINSLEENKRKVQRLNFDLEGYYYQLKSRYLLVLNHFKSPGKPGKIMEPGVLRELLEEANRRPKGMDVGATDTLGFYLRDKESTVDPNDLLQTASDCQQKATQIEEANKLEQSEEYMNWLQSWDALLVNFVNRQLVATPELKTLVRTGVPEAYRSQVWKSLINLSVRDKIADLGKGYYECMLRKANQRKNDGVYDSAIKQIDLDLVRTLPSNAHYDDPSSGRIEKLRSVLYAYRYHNKEVGYCQGLNRLAAIALLYLDEEDSFWFMVACVEHLQPDGYYSSSLIGAVADQKVLRDLVAEKVPKLAAHLRSLEVDLSLFSLGWFLTCFVDVLPHTVYLNIFDIFLYEGNKVLFRFALAMLKISEAEVLKCKTIGTVHACLSKAAEHIPDFKVISQIAFNDLNPFSQKQIETKRQIYLQQLQVLHSP